MEETIEDGSLFVTTTGKKEIITAEHMAKMKGKTFVCNIGHFDNEIQVSSL